MLSVRRGAEAVEFYKTAFGAEEVFRIESPDGQVVSRLSIEGAEFWVADESPPHANFSPESLGGGTVRMILTVPDPDAAFNQAVAAGARVVVPVENNLRLAPRPDRRSVRPPLGDRPPALRSGLKRVYSAA
jgi:PhnB protein